MLTQFISGAILAGFCTAGLFFLRFWRKSRDPLFAKFAIAFFLLGAERFLLLEFSPNDEHGEYIFFTRLAAYLIIIFAIIDKNRKK
jgi:hypothetical protein